MTDDHGPLHGQPPAAHAAAQQAAQRLARRTPTWLVVLLTAGVMTAIAVAFVVGLVVGVSLGGNTGLTSAGGSTGDAVRDSSATPQGDNQGGTEPGQDAARGASGVLDECVVGTWQGVQHEEDWKTEQGKARLTGLKRTMTFAADGTQTIVYDGDQASITTDQGPISAVFDGEVVYRTSTSGSTMSFDLQSSTGTVTLTVNGQEKREDLKPGTGDVRYTCDANTLRQEADRYLSVYQRAG